MYDLKLPDVNIKHKGLFLPIRSAAVCMSSLIRNTSLIWIKASTWYGYVLMISYYKIKVSNVFKSTCTTNVLY